MKKITTILASIILAISVIAQTPQNMSYQAVVRNNENQLVVNQSIGMQISILQGSADGEVVYTETQIAETNANGLLSIEIGAGESTSKMSDNDWANGPYFIKTETDLNGGTDYSIVAVSQLLSVPFAMYAQVAEKANSVDISGNEEAFANFDKDASDDFDGDYNSLANKPEFTDTKLTETEVDAMVANNGYVTKDSVLTETQVDAMVANNGYLTSFTEVDGDVTNEIQALSISNDTVFLSNGGFVKLPTSFSGSYNDLTEKPDLSIYLDDTDTKLTEAEVDAFANNNGYLTSFTEVDGDATNEIQSISRSGLTVTLSNGGTYKDSVLSDADIADMGYVKTDAYSKTESNAKYLTAELDGDATNEIQSISRTDLTVTLTNGGTFTDSVLTETEVDTYVANNGYQLAADDLDIDASNEIQDLSFNSTSNLLRITGNGSATTVNLSKYLDDTDTQLSETEVDNFVANNGYLTSFTEIDGSVTNEIQDLALNSTTNILTITNNGNASSIDLSAYLDDTDTKLTETEVDGFVANNGFATKDMSNNKITNLADPTEAQDAATKAYVDELEKLVESLIGWHNNSGSTALLTTGEMSEITNSTATASADIFSAGGTAITDRGFVWSTTQNPTITSNEGSVSSGSGDGSFTGSLTGLSSLTTYFVRAYATNTDGTSYGNEISFESGPGVGDYYQGGVVYYIFSSGENGYVTGETHGLICAVSDETSTMWGPKIEIPGADGMEIGDGAQNTMDIIAVSTGQNTAASICNDKVMNGYDDWFLPSRAELVAICENKDAINPTAIANGGDALFATVDDYYISSSEYSHSSNYYFWGLRFNNCWLMSRNRAISDRVRAVRAF